MLFDEPGIGRPSELWLLRVKVHRPRPARPVDGDSVSLCTQVYTLSLFLFNFFLALFFFENQTLQTSSNQDDIDRPKLLVLL